MKITKEYIAAIFFAVAVFAMLFQFWNRKLSVLIVPCLGVFLILEISKAHFETVHGWIILFFIYCIFLSINMMISISAGSGTISTGLRFFLILFSIPVAGIIQEDKFEIEWRSFRIMTVLRAIITMVMWVMLLIQQDYTNWRKWAREQGVGDIYILNDRLPRIQLVGSSLFVLGFVLDFYKNKKITPYGVFMCAGAIVSGNSAYILGIACCFAFYYMSRLFRWMADSDWHLLLCLPIAVIGIALFVRYAVYSLSLKADWSNAIRLEQASILLDTNFLWGSGLGHIIRAHTFFRDYTADIYFELQTLYIFNQIGVIGLLMFYVLTIVPFVRKKKTKLMAYLVYLIYTFWNPYCFDSTHIIAVIMISNVLKEQPLSSKQICGNQYSIVFGRRGIRVCPKVIGR